MTQEHPITPPPELVIEWWNQCTVTSDNLIRQFATQAARWGADQELEACCEWIESESCLTNSVMAKRLRDARRPKPPSLKEEALAVLDDASNRIDAAHENTIRRALESMPS
jgi:hypothetical protein